MQFLPLLGHKRRVVIINFMGFIHKVYAKLNIEMLRQCAIEVPEPTGNFKEFLQGGGYL
jgi:hypothetical protein